jgi:hypothetical protein
MLTATGFFSARESAEAHLVFGPLLTAIGFGPKNEFTGHFRSRRKSWHRRPEWRALCQCHKKSSRKSLCERFADTLYRRAISLLPSPPLRGRGDGGEGVRDVALGRRSPPYPYPLPPKQGERG